MLAGCRTLISHMTPPRGIVRHGFSKYNRSLVWRQHLRPAATTAAAAVQPTTAGKHYVVVGAGLAGLSTAYHLLVQGTPQQPVRVTVYDAVGIGAGGSGAAAGLLHPFAPNGKLLWRAEEAMAAALQLLKAAEEAAAAADPGLAGQLAWHTGMLKPATSVKQSQSFWRLYGSHPPPQQQQQHVRSLAAPGSSHSRQGLSQQLQALLSGAVMSVRSAQQLLPGVQFPGIATSPGSKLPATAPYGATSSSQEEAVQHNQQQQQQQQGQQQPEANSAPRKRQRRQQQQQQQQQPPAGWSPDGGAALHVLGGVTLQPLQYMQALWSACQQAALARQDGSSIQLRIQQLHSLQGMLNSTHSTQHAAEQPLPQAQQQQQQHSVHPVDAVVVAAGAAVGSLAEVGQQLPLTLCQGYTLDMVPPPGAATTAAACCQGGAAPADQQPSNATAVQSSSSSNSTTSSSSSGRQNGAAAAACDAAVSCCYPADAPSLLGSPYLASQGGQVLVVGATKQYNWTTEQAVAELGRHIDPSILAADLQCSPAVQGQQQAAEQLHSSSTTGDQQGDMLPGSVQAATAAAVAAGGNAAELSQSAEVAAAAQELLQGAAAAWPPICSWRVAGVRSGVRALPPRTPEGALPLVGRWMYLAAPPIKATSHEQQQQQDEDEDEELQGRQTGRGGARGRGTGFSNQQQQTARTQGGQPDAEVQGGARVPVWLLVGLGARGLVYHAWLGQLVAAAVVNDSEDALPPELLAWRQQQVQAVHSSK